MNEQLNLFDDRPLIQRTIERIKFAHDVAKQRELGALYVCFSGGKDSVVLAETCRLAKERYPEIEYELHYNITGIDPPEVVYFIRDQYPQVIRHQHGKSIFRLIEEKGAPPTRLMRYCCAELKEHGGEGRMALTGVRWAESVKRAGRKPFEKIAQNKEQKMLFNDNVEDRREFERCEMKSKFVANPIIDWTDQNVWEFIREKKLPYCSLYDEGFSRIGCIGCPMAAAKEREREFARNPKFKDAYIRAFARMLDERHRKGMKTTEWQTPQDVYGWWTRGEDVEKQIEGQINMFGGEKSEYGKCLIKNYTLCDRKDMCCHDCGAKCAYRCKANRSECGYAEGQ